MTSFFEIIDLNLFMGLVLVVMLFLLRKKGVRSFQSRLFQGLILSIIVMLMLEAILWMLNGKSPQLQYALSFAFYLLETVPLFLWLSYVDYHFHKSRNRLRRRWYYAQPFLVVLFLLTVSIPSGFVFSFDAHGLYRRGPGIFLISVVNAVLILAPIVVVLYRRKELEDRVVRVVVGFTILPIFGIIGQTMTYETSVLWPSVALATIYGYLYVEKHRETRDYLTNLYNRQQIDELILFRMDEYKNRGSFALVMIDMDGFKDINDRFGHKEGDRALVTMSGILNKSIRSVDTIGRFGGDEFLILLEEDKPEKIKAAIDRTLSQIEELNCQSGKDYHLEFSYGWEIYSPEKHHDLESLLHHVDTAMYAAKKKKKE